MEENSSQDDGQGKIVTLYTTPDNHAYFNPTPGEITRLALTPNKIGTIPDNNLCMGMAECGFNAATIWFDNIVPNSEGNYLSVVATIQNCRANGIAPFILASTLLNEASRNALVSKYARDSRLAGWYLFTPVFNEIVGENSEDFGGKAEAYNAICETDKNAYPDSRHIVIMYAHPNEETAGTDYRSYLINFQDKVRPSMWGTTVYPVVADKNGVNVFQYDLFFRDLQIMSLVSRYCERPFWYTVRCQSYTIQSGSYIPYPSVEEMRFSAFSALAYGAQGLLFWSYRQRENEPTVTFQNAPIDRNGNKVENIWNAVQTVNNEIKALNGIFFESFPVDVRHTGSKQYDATSMLTGGFGPLISISTENAGVLVSHLNTHGKDYLVIVNHTFMTGEADSQKITLTFADMWTVKQIKASNGTPTETAVTSKTVSVNLPRGGYLIYKWS